MTHIGIRRHGIWLAAAAAVVLGVGTTALAAGTGVFDVHSNQSYSAGCQAPAPVGNAVRVTVSDMGAMMGGGSMMGGANSSGVGRMGMSVQPQTVPAGKVTLDVVNMGMRDHEVLVLPLAVGRSVGRRTIGSDGRIDESGSLGEVSNSCAADAGDGLRPGATGWTTIDLAPGRYELVCNIPGHYAAGAFAELDVS